MRLNVSQPALSKRLKALEPEARRLLEQAEVVEGLMQGLGRAAGPLRVAASHSASEAIVTDVLSARGDDDSQQSIELLTANSHVVRALVAEERVELGVAAARPGSTPNPGVRELLLAEDVVVCAVPRGHPWAQRRRITQAEFLRTPMVVRDAGANARWTVESVLNRLDLRAATPIAQCPTPTAVRQEALARNAPLLLSRHVLRSEFFVEVDVPALHFPRRFELVLPALGEPSAAVKALIERLEAAVAAW